MQSTENAINEWLRKANLHVDGAIPRYFSLKDLIEVTGLGRSSIYRRCNDGTFPKPIKLGARSMWKRDEFLAALERIERQSDAPTQELQPVTSPVRKRKAPKLA